MPRLEQHLHFRQVDIGTVAALVNAWYPGIEYVRSSSNHRALGDIKESIAELRYYCEHAFEVDLSRVSARRER
jgi:oligoribonuclease